MLATVNRADDEAWVPARRNVGVAQMPVGLTGKFYTFVGGSNLMVFKSSSHKNEAFRLIQYLSQNTVQRNYARIMGMFPARLVPQRQEGNRNANSKAFYQAIKHGRTYAPIASWGRSRTRTRRASATSSTSRLGKVCPTAAAPS